MGPPAQDGYPAGQPSPPPPCFAGSESEGFIICLATARLSHLDPSEGHTFPAHPHLDSKQPGSVPLPGGSSASGGGPPAVASPLSLSLPLSLDTAALAWAHKYTCDSSASFLISF